MLKPVVVKIHSIQQDEIGKKTEFELVSTGIELLIGKVGIC